MWYLECHGTYIFIFGMIWYAGMNCLSLKNKSNPLSNSATVCLDYTLQGRNTEVKGTQNIGHNYCSFLTIHAFLIIISNL